MSQFRNLRFGILTSVLMALVLVSSTSLAQNKLFKNKYSVTLATTDASNSVATAGTTSTVVCRSLNGCAFLFDQTMGVEDPAIRFLLGAAETVHLDAEVNDGLDCMDPAAMVSSGDLALNPPRSTVFLNFMPPLAAGTMLSIKWAVNFPQCPVTQCINYVIGPDPNSQPNFCARVPTQP